MKKENLWLSYQDEDKKEMNRICEWYKKCLDEGKTERECTELVVKMAKEQGYQDLCQIIREGKKVQAGVLPVSFVPSSSRFACRRKSTPATTPSVSSPGMPALRPACAPIAT